MELVVDFLREDGLGIADHAAQTEGKGNGEEDHKGVDQAGDLVQESLEQGIGGVVVDMGSNNLGGVRRLHEGGNEMRVAEVREENESKQQEEVQRPQGQAETHVEAKKSGVKALRPKISNRKERKLESQKAQVQRSDVERCRNDLNQ